MHAVYFTLPHNKAVKTEKKILSVYHRVVTEIAETRTSRTND